MEEIPQWAKERAIQLFNEHLNDSGYQSWRVTAHGNHPAVTAFARYIAEHEEPPVDPLLIEARKLAAEAVEGRPRMHTPESFLSGEMDGEPGIQAVLAALRRGMELAKSETANA